MPDSLSHPRRLGVHILVLLATLIPAVATAQTLPPGWTVSDVGAPLIPGYGTFQNATFTVSGSGSGIRSAADQFTFIHRSMVGDSTIVAFVDRITATLGGEAGVMVRHGLGANAAHTSIVVSPANQLTFKRRRIAGSTTTSTAVTTTSARLWLRLQRQGATVTASWSADGTTWTVLGSDTVPMNNVVRVGMVVTSNLVVAPAQAQFTGVATSSLVEYGGPLPSGWSSQDIGAPATPGAAAYGAGTFALMGGGSDIGGSSDQFRLASIQADRDIDIVARVRDLGDTDPLSKAGITIRDSLTPNGAHASMLVTASGTTMFRRRPLPGGTTVTTAGLPAAAPTWLKLSLRNGVVTGSQSMDGVSWTVVGTETLTLPMPFHAGLAVTSRNAAATVVTNIDGVAITVDETPNSNPTVSLTSPADGSTHTAPATLTVSANAADTDGTIARVDFFQNGTLIASDTTSPYSVSWSSVAAGSYSLTAVATDDAGGTTTSAPRSITVSAANQPPSVVLTAPADGSTHTAPATITVSANASDTDGTIARVDFYQGSTLIGSDTTSPYSVTWSSVPAGTYSVTARATDDDGATATSSARTITVTAANQPPAVALTSPANGATFTAPATITVSANASDTDGTISRVDFYQGSSLIGSDTTSPYSITWNNVGAGSYSLTARAVDNTGATTTSAARTITVGTATTQRNAAFTPSADHATLVNSYHLEIFAAGANPQTATPLATQDLGKPAVVNGECSADITNTLNGLAPGSYQATVSAVGSGGSSRSAPATFTR